MKTTFIASFKKAILLSAIFSLAVFASYATAAWTEPSATPPGNNTDTPINVGSQLQTKLGNFNANVIGVNGLCLGTDCRTSWPSGGEGGGVVNNGGPTKISKLSGSGSWTVPAGVTVIEATLVGGGGGGGNGSNGCNLNNKRGDGGGSGAVIVGLFTVAPGSTISYSVGSGGSAESAGGSTSFNGVTAGGGGAGGGDSNASGGSASTGQTPTSGTVSYIAFPGKGASHPAPGDSLGFFGKDTGAGGPGACGGLLNSRNGQSGILVIKY